ncbi:hypothetical protein DRE_06636 [Drechslerella stenobrocha 248]|uniref:Uncharacterized protein n=1 Tax=Drechslerella stenobrocha 248 TaxID=1043628 RepID=W7HX17_9PEZI|nr:hypothetical protein DRE_06636 [Drechslerella stenobrocha 248]
MVRQTSVLLPLLSILLHLCPLASASPAPQRYPELTIFARQSADAICGTGSARCSDASISNFCCPTNTECIGVLNNTAVGCCPTGQDCRVLSPSDCPASSGSGSQFTRCTTGKCCPPGYLCDGNFCQLQYESWPQNQNVTDPTTSPTETPAPTSEGDATSLSEAQREAGFISRGECPAVTGGGFAAGFFPGLVIGAVLATMIFCIRERKKEKMARQWTRTPSSGHRSRKRSHGSGDGEKGTSGSKSSSRQKVTIGYQPEVVVTAPPQVYDGLSVPGNIAGQNYAVSNTSTQMFAQYEEPSEPARRGRLRVHGETPPLPSLAILGITDSSPSSIQPSSESLPQSSGTDSNSSSKDVEPSKKHRRKHSNPSFRDLASVSKFKFKNLLSHENLKEQRGSLASETSVGSSIHSSIFTASERQSRGNRYPVAVPGMPSKSSRSRRSGRDASDSPQDEFAIRRANTTATQHTNFEEDNYTPITPPNHRPFLGGADAAHPSSISAAASQNYPNLNIPPHARGNHPQAFTSAPHENHLNVPEGLKDSRASVATEASEMTEIDGYRSPFHDRFQYGSYTSDGSSGYEDDVDDDGRSIAANSAYPASFLDIHFNAANSPISPSSADARSQYSPGGQSPSDVPAMPTIPPLFQHKNKLSGDSSSSGSRPGAQRGQLGRESGDIPVAIDDGRIANQRWRGENANMSGTSVGATGIGGAMTGGRYTMQTMEINKF